jgi:hypothetical protein
VAETFELEVLVEEDIAHSSLDTDLFYPLYPGVIGFYRIKGVKNNPLD